MHLELIAQSAGIWAYILLAVLTLFEGPVATLAGAVAAAAGFMKPEGVFIAASIGNLSADSLWYALGYAGKVEWLERYGRWAGVTPAAVQRFRSDIEKHAAKILFVAKMTLGFSIPTLIATGLSRVPMRRWFPWLLLGETIWTGLLVVTGYYFTRYVQQFERGVEIVAFIGVFAGAVIILLYVGNLRHKAQVEIITK